MIKKILKYTAIGFILFVLLVMWILFIQPKIDHNKNLNELEDHIEFFNLIKHPESTSEIHYNAFFGNSSGTSNHCEHIIIQIRKYDPEKEKEIEDYYKNNYADVNVSFVKTLDDCCGTGQHGYEVICNGYFAGDQPKFTMETAKDILPVYIVEYWVDGSHLWDWKCN